MTQEQIQTIADECSQHGYNFRVALRTAARDGEPFYRTERETYEYQRELAMLTIEGTYA